MRVNNSDQIIWTHSVTLILPPLFVATKTNPTTNVPKSSSVSFQTRRHEDYTAHGPTSVRQKVQEQGNLLPYIKILCTSYANKHLNCFLEGKHAKSSLSAWRIWLPLRYMRRWWAVAVEKCAFLNSCSSFEVKTKEFFLICLKSPISGLSDRAFQISACGFLVRKIPQNLTQVQDILRLLSTLALHTSWLWSSVIGAVGLPLK